MEDLGFGSLVDFRNLLSNVGGQCQTEGMTPDPYRFFDGGAYGDPEPPEPRREMEIRLQRHLERRDRGPAPEREVFALERRVAYDHPEFEGVFVVPTEEGFRTDLTSVPDLFTWLVPRTGVHLPAALVHDALVDADDDPQPYIGVKVKRYQADLIFRDAMGDLGTGTIRRWLMWTAVTLNTMWKGLAADARAWCRYYKYVMAGTLAVIGLLGVAATLDLFDVPRTPRLPWMGGLTDSEEPFLVELGAGAVMAVVIPFAVAWLWGRQYRKAGMIAGVALALLLHVTVVLFVLTLLLSGLERATRQSRYEAMYGAGGWDLPGHPGFPPP